MMDVEPAPTPGAAIAATAVIDAIEKVRLKPGDLLLIRKDQCIGQILAGLDVGEDGTEANFHHVAVYMGLDDQGQHEIIHVRFGAMPCVVRQPLADACTHENWIKVQAVSLTDDDAEAMATNAAASHLAGDVQFAVVDTVMVMISLLWIAAKWQELRAPASNRKVLMLAAAWAMVELERNHRQGMPTLDEARFFAGDGGPERTTCSEIVVRWMSDDLRDRFVQAAIDRRAPSADQIVEALDTLDDDRPDDADEADAARLDTAEAILAEFRQLVEEPRDDDLDEVCTRTIGRLDGLCGAEDDRPLGSVVRDVAAAIYAIAGDFEGMDDETFTEAARVAGMMDIANADLADIYRNLLPDFVTPGDFERAAASGLLEIVFDLP